MPTLDWIGKRAVLNHHREIVVTLVEGCGVELTYLGAIERGSRNPTLLGLRRIATALAVEVGSRVPGHDTHVPSPAKFWPFTRS